MVDDDSPDAATADPLAADPAPSALTVPAGPASADPALRPAESPVTEPLDDEIAALSRRTRRPRRVAALAAGAAALLALGAVVALSAPGRTVHVVGGAPARALAEPKAIVLARAPAPGAPPTAPVAARPREPRAGASAAAPPAANGADLSAAVQAAVSGGAVDAPDTTAVLVRSDPPGAMLFRDAKQLGRGTVEVKVRRGERAIVLALLDQHQPTRVTIDGSIPEVVIALPRVRRAWPAAPAAAPRPAATGPATPVTSAAPRAHTAPPPVAPEPPVVEPPQIDTTDLPAYPDPFHQPL